MLRASACRSSRGLNSPSLRHQPGSSSSPLLPRGSSTVAIVAAGRGRRNACPVRRRCFSSAPREDEEEEGGLDWEISSDEAKSEQRQSLRRGIEHGGGQSSFYAPPGRQQARVSPVKQARLQQMEQAAVTLQQLRNERIIFPGLFVAAPGSSSPAAKAGGGGNEGQEPAAGTARDGERVGGEGGKEAEGADGEGKRAEKDGSGGGASSGGAGGGASGEPSAEELSPADRARKQAEKEARVLAGALRILQRVLVREVDTPEPIPEPTRASGRDPDPTVDGWPPKRWRPDLPIAPFAPLKGLFVADADADADAQQPEEGQQQRQPLGKPLSKWKFKVPKNASPEVINALVQAAKENAAKEAKAKKSAKAAKTEKAAKGQKSAEAKEAKANRKALASTKKVTIKGAKDDKSSKWAKRKPGDKSVEDSTSGGEERRAVVIEKVGADSLVLAPIHKPQRPVPGLSFGLDRALFNPGVYHLQDPRSRVYNFDPYLARIMPIHEFDFQALKQYITSSKDNTLIRIAAEHGKRYTGSTSSMTGLLAHFHFLLSSFRDLNYSNLSRHFNPEGSQPTLINKAPSAGFLHWKDGVYAIDADKQYDKASILTMLGKSMEKLLTLPKEEFEKYRRSRSDEISQEDRNDPESYHYSTLGDFMMRSQLDAYDPRIPGTGMFDLKTRAVITIRMNTASFQLGQGYEIRGRFGQWDSFEREYHDMIRSAYLKYSLQVRMGRMDGIFVAYHNTERIFGFQYVPLSEMDVALHGTDDTRLGDAEFRLSLHLFNKLLDRATAKYPGQSLRMHVEARPAAGSAAPSFMYFFAKPVTGEEIERIQNTQRDAVEKFERDILGLGAKEGEAEGEAEAEGEGEGKEEEAKDVTADEVPPEQALAEGAPLQDFEHGVIIDEDAVDQKVAEDDDETTVGVWEDVMDKVEEMLRNEEEGVTFVREAIADAFEQSGLLQGSTPDEARRYVDKLLALVTTDAQEASSAAPEAEDDASLQEDAAEDADMAEPQDLAAQEAGEATLEAGETPLEADEAQDEYVQPNAEEGVEAAEAEPEATAAAVAATGATEEPAIPAEEQEDENEPSLKDLIVRIASQVRLYQTETESLQEAAQEEEDERVVAQKLRKFEKIISEMIAKANALPSSSSRETGVVGDGGPSPPEGLPQQEGAAEGAGATGLAAAVAGAQRTAKGAPPSPAALLSSTGGAGPDTTAEGLVDNEEVMGMILTIKNKVNGHYVQRPERLDKSDAWTVEYAIEEMTPERARVLFPMTVGRRANCFKRDQEEADREWHFLWRGMLAKQTNAGRAYREAEDKASRAGPVHVYGVDRPLRWRDAFPNRPPPARASAPTRGREDRRKAKN